MSPLRHLERVANIFCSQNPIFKSAIPHSHTFMHHPHIPTDGWEMLKKKKGGRLEGP